MKLKRDLFSLFIINKCYREQKGQEIENGQSMETGNIGFKTQNEDPKKTQHRKLKR